MSEIILNNSATPDNPSSGKVKIYSGTDSVVRVINSSGSITPITKSIAIFNETQPNNTQGGDFNSGANRTRTLNTTVYNGISGCSLSSNQITLPVGTYYIYASCPAIEVNDHQSYFYNITDSSYGLYGTSEYSNLSTQSRSIINGIITITSAKVFEVKHRCSTTKASYGFGLAANFGNSEVYTIISIEKIA